MASRLRESNPENSRAYHLTAEAQYKLGNYPAAAEAAHAALKINPEDKVALAHWMLNKDRTNASALKPSAIPDTSERVKEPARGNGGFGNLPAVAARSVLANLPAPPSPVETEPIPKDATLATIAKVAFTAAATATGGLLLFGGLGGQALEEKFPNIRRNMGIAAGIGGAFAVAAISLPAVVTGLYASPPVLEGTGAIVAASKTPTGQRMVSRAGQILSNPQSAVEAAKLKEHLRQLQRYGNAGYKVLADGRIRYYRQLDPADKVGIIKGRRFVREWNPVSGVYRDWMENVDHMGRVRILHPKSPPAPHYIFDEMGKNVGSF